MSDEALVRVDRVSKKFCRSLKRSLWYGVQDVASELLGRKGSHDRLRKNEFWAVDDVSFELRRGECLGLIGPNGAGKSTLLKMLNGLVKPDKGTIALRGRVGALIELGAGFNPILTARENIYINGAVLGFSKSEIDRKFDAIVEFAEILEFIDTPVQNLSSGMKLRLGFSIAAQMDPDVLLIDEVLAVGDASFRAKCMAKMYEQLNDSCVIFVSHSMAQINRICNMGLYINHGKPSAVTNQVSSAIQMYLEECPVPEYSQLGQENFVIGEVTLESDGSRVRDGRLLMNTGSGLEFAILLTTKTDLRRCAFMLAFFDRELRNVAECYSGTDIVQNLSAEAPCRINVSIPSVNLSPGKYSIQFSCVSLDGEGRREKVHLVLRNLAELVVTGADYSYAATQFHANWSTLLLSESKGQAASN